MIKFLGCFIQTFACYASFEFNEKCKPLNVFAKTAVLEKYIIHKKTKLIPFPTQVCQVSIFPILCASFKPFDFVAASWTGICQV